MRHAGIIVPKSGIVAEASSATKQIQHLAAAEIDLPSVMIASAKASSTPALMAASIRSEIHVMP
jgi:hypothetical protein